MPASTVTTGSRYCFGYLLMFFYTPVWLINILYIFFYNSLFVMIFYSYTKYNTFIYIEKYINFKRDICWPCFCFALNLLITRCSFQICDLIEFPHVLADLSEKQISNYILKNWSLLNLWSKLLKIMFWGNSVTELIIMQSVLF